MRIVFMGTPELAALVLANLAERHDVVGVFTRPDAVRGRGKKLEPSPVKRVAVERGIPVTTMKSLKGDEAQRVLRELAPDLICVAACGVILPPEVLAIPRYGCLNVHTSLLPRWRGAAPMQRSILACDEVTGVSIMRMEEGLDTGAYCKQEAVGLEGVYLDDLQRMLAERGSALLLAAIDELEGGTLEWIEQGEEGVTYAEKIGKGELDLDPTETACMACAKVRASDSAHPAHASIAGKHATFERISPADDENAAALCEGLEPGEAVFRAKRFLCMASDGPFEIEMIKPEGKKSMDARSFASGIQGIKNATLLWGRA